AGGEFAGDIRVRIENASLEDIHRFDVFFEDVVRPWTGHECMPRACYRPHFWGSLPASLASRLALSGSFLARAMIWVMLPSPMKGLAPTVRGLKRYTHRHGKSGYIIGQLVRQSMPICLRQK